MSALSTYQSSDRLQRGLAGTMTVPSFVLGMLRTIGRVSLRAGALEMRGGGQTATKAMLLRGILCLV